ncbi:MAG TPA: hypothetical protein V6D10_07120 [Trichocoleus sp.]|jgi:hypothetical protein
MAIQDVVAFAGLSTDTGYWRVGNITIDTTPIDGSMLVSVRLDGYASLEARNSGESAVQSTMETILVQPESLSPSEALLLTNFRGWIYVQLGQFDRWAGKPQV